MRAEIADADVVLIQLEIPMDTALAAARTGRAGGAVVVLNASPSGTPQAQLEELASTVDVVVVNDHESGESHWSVPHLVVTRGARGAAYEGSVNAMTSRRPPWRRSTPTGAGDVFAGVLAADWHLGPRTALIRACAAGALADPDARRGRLRADPRGHRRRAGVTTCVPPRRSAMGRRTSCAIAIPIPDSKSAAV